MPSNIHNPFAPPATNGISDPGPGESDLYFVYVYDVTLTALQILNAQQVPIDSDSDFVLRGIVVGWPAGGGPFLFRLYDAQNFARSNGMLYSTNLSADPSAPTVVTPELTFPAGNKIQLDIADVSNAGNQVQLLFIGVKRFRVS
jgi:hypothetical protein